MASACIVLAFCLGKNSEDSYRHGLSFLNYNYTPHLILMKMFEDQRKKSFQ